MSSRKKKRSDLVRFHRLKEGQRRQKGTFDKEWAAKFAESDKGSFYDQEKLPNCGHAAASKFLSFIGLAPIKEKLLGKTIEGEVRVLLEEELSEAAREVKECKFSLGELNCSREELDNAVVDAGVTIDASWCSRGWTATDAVVAAISVDTGKVVDVVHMSSSCSECTKMEKRRTEGGLSRLEYLAWLNSHDSNCFLNHESSSAVSQNIL